MGGSNANQNSAAKAEAHKQETDDDVDDELGIGNPKPKNKDPTKGSKDSLDSQKQQVSDSRFLYFSSGYSN
jgi:hypothetical protein